VRANNNIIYCAPYISEHILKININDGTVETLDNIEMRFGLWLQGELASDNSIYFMPSRARRIMRPNPDNDTLSSVGDDLGRGYKYGGTVVGNDDCVYGIPYFATHIIKFDPVNPDTSSAVGEEAEERFECGNGVLGGDGYIYDANQYGEVLQIDTTNNHYTWIGDRIFLGSGAGQGDPIVGVDKCIYWPPSDDNSVLKTRRYNNCHRSWGMTSVQEVTNGRVEL
jgi:hypothetical protein